MSAGVASAEITLSGSARMGLVHTGKIAGKAAVAGQWATAESVTNTSIAGVFGADGVVDDYSANNLSAPSLTNGVATSTTTQMSALTAARANAAALRANLASLAGASTDTIGTGENDHASTPVANTKTLAQLDADIAALDAAIAAASGTAAVAAVDAKTVFDNRIQININASAETSSGLTFGASTRARIDEKTTGVLAAPRVYMKSGAVEVAMGNIYGAIDSMPGVYQSEAGLVGNGAGDVVQVVYDGYSSQGAGSNGVEVIYSAGAFTGHLSYTDSDLGSASNRVAAYGAYTMNDWTVALGTQQSDAVGEDLLVMTAAGKVGDFGVGFSAADNDGTTKMTLNGGMTFGATSVSAFVSDQEGATDNAYGVGFAHDLGGASLVGAVERNINGTNYADFGVSFSF